MGELFIGGESELVRTFVERCERWAHAAIAARGQFTMALPGGSVAEAFLPALVGSTINFRRTRVFFGDERAVSPDNPASNYHLAKTTLLDRVAIPEENVHRMSGENPSLDEAAATYSDVLRRELGSPPRLNLALLGVGPDGHVCSLFPGHASLAVMGTWTVAVEDSPKPPPRRLTLTMPVLFSARSVAIAAFGESKAHAMRGALEDPTSPLPVSIVLRRATDAVVLLDPAAASELEKR